MPFSRVVVRVPNWLGDAVMALPAIAAVSRHAGGAEVTLAAPASVAPLFAEDAGLADVRTLVLPSRRRDQIAALAA